MDLVFDIETDDLKATKVWCIVAQDVDTKEAVSYTHLTLPTTPYV